MSELTEQINDGGPAFACAVPACPPEHAAHFITGMSLRDWFAGQALVTGDDQPATAGAMADFIGRPTPSYTVNYPDWLVWMAEFEARVKYIKADAMLVARKAKS